MQHDGSRRKAMGFMPMVRSQNTSAAVPGNRTESLSPVLPKVQKGKHYQCKELYRFMMAIMVKTAGKGLAAKENRTPEEDDMLDMILHGGERVKFADLKQVLDWYKSWRNMDDDER